MHANNVYHFAINAANVERAKKFYAEVFGWRFEEWGPPDFYLIRTGNEKSPGIQGALQRRSEPLQKGINGYECSISVSNIDQITSSVIDNGGKILVKKVEIPTVGLLVRFEDTEGNIACAVEYFNIPQ